MIAKGWLIPGELADADSLAVELAGAARALIAPAASEPLGVATVNTPATP
jgi:hypothetical protein